MRATLKMVTEAIGYLKAYLDTSRLIFEELGGRTRDVYFACGLILH
jgi:hypothetical protein